MFYLEAPDEKIPALRDRWDLLGESIVVVGEDGLWNCHIHTDDVGAAIEAGVEAGRPRRIRVTDLVHHDGELEADVAAGGFSPLSQVLAAPIGVVTVAEGPGLVERFRRLGVQQVVVRGRSEPTVDQLLTAVEEAPADALVILPNARTLVALAEHVDGLTTKTVAVVPTRSVPQGLAAMLAYRPDTDHLDALLDDMAVAAGAIDYGEVTQSARDARVDGWHVTRGDWLGVADGRVVVVDRDRFATLRGLVAAILPSNPQVVTLYAGEHATRSDIKALEAWIGETHPNVAVRAEDGGQVRHPYLVSVE